jgi:hypothetical protein
LFADEKIGFELGSDAGQRLETDYWKYSGLGQSKSEHQKTVVL